jgi:hypothetical protein
VVLAGVVPQSGECVAAHVGSLGPFRLFDRDPVVKNALRLRGQSQGVPGGCVVEQGPAESPQKPGHLTRSRSRALEL